jgi:nucleotidyltransferase substrate binding protein (TIGR01987 family)
MPENELIVIALIKAYEFSFELSWKTLKDLLAWNGVDARLPREVLKQAFATGLIDEGQIWIDMLEQRNLMTHTYDQARALQAVELIASHYWPQLQRLQNALEARRESI